MKSLLSVKQVAFILKVHPLTIRRYIKEKKLKAVKLGGNIRIDEKDLETFHHEVEEQTSEKSQLKTFRKADNQFTPDDPFLQLQGRAASLRLNS